MSTSQQTDRRPPPLPPGQQLVAAGKWPLIGEREPAAGNQPWQLTLSGAGCQARFSLAELHEMKQTTLSVDIHCVTRWSKLAVEFTGVLLEDLIGHAPPAEGVEFVSFVAQSDRNHSTSLSLAEAMEQKTLIAHTCQGQPLPTEHGGPLRNIVPGKYFYKSVKWLKAIDFLTEDRLGFWEAESGYHNGADPWREERYMAPTIDRRTAARLIADRNFSGHDLRSLDASGRDLSGLSARGAALRNANFNETDLSGADLSAANMSNSHLRQTNLRSAQLVGTDLEGANLAGADLRGADLTDSSLIGSSFCQWDEQGKVVQGACIDATTILPRSLLEPLTPEQRDYVLAQLDESARSS
ncbi:MAG: molybdopterin-dependent oxidoreductase [Mariniblastus sp.]|nr:molybdopterin-dependent oxidoreductase [Mariniblastus sp.]